MKASIKKRKGFNITDLALVIVAVLLALFFTIKSPFFLSIGNLMNMVQAISIIGIAASIATITLIAVGIDLSQGSIMAFASCFAVKLMTENGLPWYGGVIVALIIGALLGYLNGIIITKAKISSLIVTLGMNLVIRGACYIFTDAKTIYLSDEKFNWFGIGRIGVVPVCGIFMLVCFIVFFIVSKHTKFGRECYATGGNIHAAHLAGIKTGSLTRKLFMLNGLLAGFAGVIMTGIVAGALPSSGENYSMDIITAMVLGGTKIGTGEGSVLKTLLGLLIIGLLNNGMALLSVPGYWQMLAKGILMIVAVVIAENNILQKNNK